MSALGSSVISVCPAWLLMELSCANSMTDKSSRKFAPKAPSRRPARGHNEIHGQPSANSSGDRRTQSQTPQPQSVQVQKEGISQPIDVTNQDVHGQRSRSAQPTTQQDRHPDLSSDVVYQQQSNPAFAQPAVPHRDTAPPRTSPVTQNHPKSSENTDPTSNIRRKRHLTASDGPILSAESREGKGSAGPLDVPSAKRQKRGLQQAESHSEVHNQTEIAQGGGQRAGVTPDIAASTESHPSPSSKSAKPVSRTAGKRNAQRDATAGESTGNADKIPQRTPKGRGSRRATQRSRRGQDDIEDDTIPSEATHQPKKPRKRAQDRVKQAEMEAAAAEIVQDAVEGTAQEQGEKRKSKRATTPEDAELIQITPSEVKMVELCKDSRTGKKSARELELRELDRAAFVKRKQGQLREFMENAESSSEPTASQPIGEREEAQREMESEIALNVPNTIIVNGQIQIDESSLRIDRHAAAALERDAEQLEGVEENDLTRKINSGSYLKRDKGGGWGSILLDRFYDGLRMFGTDFGMISKMFPGKSRHSIKLKFVREERENPAKIRAVLMGEQIPVDLDEFQKLTGTEYRDPELLEKEIEADRKALEEEQAAEKEALEQARLERVAQAAAETETTATSDNGSSTKENKGKRKKQEKGKGGGGGKQKSGQGKPRTKARQTVRNDKKGKGRESSPVND